MEPSQNGPRVAEALGGSEPSSVHQWQTRPGSETNPSLRFKVIKPHTIKLSGGLMSWFARSVSENRTSHAKIESGCEPGAMCCGLPSTPCRCGGLAPPARGGLRPLRGPAGPRAARTGEAETGVHAQRQRFRPEVAWLTHRTLAAWRSWLAAEKAESESCCSDCLQCSASVGGAPFHAIDGRVAAGGGPVRTLRGYSELRLRATARRGFRTSRRSSLLCRTSRQRKTRKQSNRKRSSAPQLG